MTEASSDIRALPACIHTRIILYLTGSATTEESLLLTPANLVEQYSNNKGIFDYLYHLYFFDPTKSSLFRECLNEQLNQAPVPVPEKEYRNVIGKSLLLVVREGRL